MTRNSVNPPHRLVTLTAAPAQPVAYRNQSYCLLSRQDCGRRRVGACTVRRKQALGRPDMSITRRRVCPDIREPADVRRSWGSLEPSIRLCMSPHTQPDGTSQAMTLVPICATSLQKGRRHDARRRIAGTRPEEQQTPGEPGVDGVDNAARTRDLLNHNQMLYRLSYIHHVVWNPRNSRFRTTVKDYTRYQGRPLLGESFFRQTLPRNAISASSSRSAPAPSHVERP